MARARTLSFQWQNKAGSFSFSKLERAQLYGQKKRVPVDGDGKECQRARLTLDGDTVLTSGMVAQGYVGTGGTLLETVDLQAVTADGEVLPEVESTLKQAQLLTGPIHPEEVLRLDIRATYALDPVDVPEDLMSALRSGQFFMLPFAYRSGFSMEQAILLANMDGEPFLHVGNYPEKVYNDAAPVNIVAEEIEAYGEESLGDLDFTMF